MAPPETTVLHRSLPLPERWAAELQEARAVGPEVGTGPTQLALSYAVSRAEVWGVDLRLVERDLERGMWLRPGRPHRYGARYWLTSEDYEVEILSKPGDNYRRKIAFVLRVARRPSEQLARRRGRFSRSARFVDVRVEVACDLDQLLQEVDLAERRQRQAVREVQSTRQDKHLQRHARLHSLATKRYGALRALLALLATRAERAVEECDGEVVVPPPDDGTAETDPEAYLYVQVAGQARSLRTFDDSLVEVSAAGRSTRIRVRNVSSTLLTMDRPARGDWDAGTPVTVRSLPRFSKKQHDRALERFLKGEVEGDWDDLAALLCKPQWLDPPPRSLPPRFYCDEDPDERPLNDEQRQAVAAALATPHAFVIQGPPGTGKTTVICEIVRQLAARGQRVLMLAPTHVAVDEVLRRIGRKPGVRALRLAADEGKVHEDVRRYMPDQVGRELVSSLRRPGPDSDTRWRARHRSLLQEAEALDRLQRAEEELARAITALAASHEAARAASQRQDEARNRHRRAAAESAAAIAAAQAEVDETDQSVETARAAESTARRRFEEVRRPVEELLAALQRLASCREELTAAVGHEQEAARRSHQWETWWEAERRRLASVHSDVSIKHRNAEVVTHAAYEQLQRAQAALASATAATPRRRLSRLADRLGFGPTARSDRAQRHWAAREQERQRWSAESQHADEALRQFEDEARTSRSDLAATASAARALRQTAESQLAAATTGWRQASERASGTVRPEPRAPALLVSQLQAALAPEGGVRLPGDLAPQGFHQARDDVRLAADRRADWERHRRLVDQRLGATRHQLADTEAQHRAAAAQLAAEVEAAAAAVTDRDAEVARVRRQRDEQMAALAYRTPPTEEEVVARRTAVERQIRVLPSLPQLRQRWIDLAAPLTDEALADEVGDALLRAVNLVCATTVGIAGVEAMSSVDFDTLIVDEASRVVDSEFLIGAIRAQRWILVGDERQLPPYVETSDEYHLHGLTALYRHERGEAETLDEAVQHLAQRWQEDDEQRRFREKEVLAEAIDVRDGGGWAEAYRDIFVDAHRHFRSPDPDAAILDAMRLHLIRSLLERAVASGAEGLREPLVVQRRMIEPLAAIVRQPVYDGRYESPDAEDLRRCGAHPLTTPTFNRPVVFLDTSNRPDRRERQVGHGFVNDLEARWIEDACRLYERELPDGEKVSVSILCFYLAQAQLLRQRFKPPAYPGFRRLAFDMIAPIDRIQGQESDLVILSFCRTHPNPGPRFGQWLQDLRRLNVACTRAHRALVLVGHRQMLERLQGVPQARQFYDHLLGLFSPDAEHYLRLSDF